MPWVLGIISTSWSKTIPWAFVNSRGCGEKTSSTPTTLKSDTTGAAISEPMPKLRQTSGSTRESLSASSHQTRRPLRTHSPDNPSRDPGGAERRGAGSPARTRQIIWSPAKNAKAAPLDPVRPRACPAMSRKTAARLFPSSRTLPRTASTEASARYQRRRRQLHEIDATAPGWPFSPMARLFASLFRSATRGSAARGTQVARFERRGSNMRSAG